MLGQFLFAALGSICREAELAPNLVGTPNDIREWIVYRTSQRRDEPATRPSWPAAGGPSSSAGCSTTCWPASSPIRVGDPKSDHPLVIG